MEFNDIVIGRLLSAINHPPDFLFTRSSADFAASLQGLLYGQTARELGVHNVKFDEDGDIVAVAQNSQSTGLLITQGSIQLTIGGEPAAKLPNADGRLKLYAAIAQTLFGQRHLPGWEGFGLKLEIVVPFLDPVAPEVLSAFLGNQFLDFMGRFQEVKPAGGPKIEHTFTADHWRHQLVIAASDLDTVLVSFDSQAFSTDIEFGGYVEFIDAAVQLISARVPQLLAPVLSHPRLDREFIRTGHRSPRGVSIQ